MAPQCDLEGNTAAAFLGCPFHLYVSSLTTPCAFILPFCFLAWWFLFSQSWSLSGDETPPPRSSLNPSPQTPSHYSSSWFISQGFRADLHLSRVHWQTYFRFSHEPMNSPRAETTFCHLCFPARSLRMNLD